MCARDISEGVHAHYVCMCVGKDQHVICVRGCACDVCACEGVYLCMR